jgi:hypothetical protein
LLVGIAAMAVALFVPAAADAGQLTIPGTPTVTNPTPAPSAPSGSGGSGSAPAAPSSGSATSGSEGDGGSAGAGDQSNWQPAESASQSELNGNPFNGPNGNPSPPNSGEAEDPVGLEIEMLDAILYANILTGDPVRSPQFHMPEIEPSNIDWAAIAELAAGSIVGPSSDQGGQPGDTSSGPGGTPDGGAPNGDGSGSQGPSADGSNGGGKKPGGDDGTGTSAE